MWAEFYCSFIHSEPFFPSQDPGLEGIIPDLPQFSPRFEPRVSACAGCRGSGPPPAGRGNPWEV